MSTTDDLLEMEAVGQVIALAEVGSDLLERVHPCDELPGLGVAVYIAPPSGW